jgi:hypothetical protein
MSASQLHPRPIIPFGVATLGIALFSTMDALMKGLSLAIGTYNALLWRTLAGAAIGGAVFFLRRSPRPGRAALRVHLIRGMGRPGTDLLGRIVAGIDGVNRLVEERHEAEGIVVPKPADRIRHEIPVS